MRPHEFRVLGAATRRDAIRFRCEAAATVARDVVDDPDIGRPIASKTAAALAIPSRRWVHTSDVISAKCEEILAIDRAPESASNGWTNAGRLYPILVGEATILSSSQQSAFTPITEVRDDGDQFGRAEKPLEALETDFTAAYPQALEQVEKRVASALPRRNDG